MPFWLTIAIGLTGSIVGAVVAKALFHNNGYVVSFGSLGVSVGRALVPPGAAVYGGVGDHRAGLVVDDRHACRALDRDERDLPFGESQWCPVVACPGVRRGRRRSRACRRE